MNKQTIIDDYKQTIERLQKECAEKTDFNIKLMERVKELEEENETLKDRFKVANAEQEDYAIKTNEKLKNLRKKLKIAEEFIEFLAGGKCSSDVCKLQSREYKNCLACFENKAQETLQKMKEANNDNNINLN